MKPNSNGNSFLARNYLRQCFRIVKLSKKSYSHKNARDQSDDVRHLDPEYYQLPPIENLQLVVDEAAEIEPFGKVTQHIEFIGIFIPLRLSFSY